MPPTDVEKLMREYGRVENPPRVETSKASYIFLDATKPHQEHAYRNADAFIFPWRGMTPEEINSLEAYSNQENANGDKPSILAGYLNYQLEKNPNLKSIIEHAKNSKKPVVFLDAATRAPGFAKALEAEDHRSKAVNFGLIAAGLTAVSSIIYRAIRQKPITRRHILTMAGYSALLARGALSLIKGEITKESLNYTQSLVMADNAEYVSTLISEDLKNKKPEIAFAFNPDQADVKNTLQRNDNNRIAELKQKYNGADLAEMGKIVVLSFEDGDDNQVMVRVTLIQNPNFKN